MNVEIVTYDPDDPDTYPSVCQTSDDVHRRFRFIGGEKLVFTVSGKYVGRLVQWIASDEPDTRRPEQLHPKVAEWTRQHHPERLDE